MHWNSIGALTVLLSLTGMCSAGIIDTRPPGQSFRYDGQLGGGDFAGGTFFADADILTSFSLFVSDNGGGGVFRAIVLAADGSGVPSGAPLYESADTAIPVALTELTFFPGISIVPGNEYFIGIDTGLLTSVNGGDVLLHYTVADLIPGNSGENVDADGYVEFPADDIASLIVMNASVPTPAALPAGLALLGVMTLRRRRSA